MSVECLQRRVMVDLVRPDECRPAELHTPLDDTGAVVSDDPLQRVWRVLLGGVRRRVLQRNRVEPKSNFSVGGGGHIVQLGEEVNVC